MNARARVVALPLALLAGACTNADSIGRDDPVDVAGVYSVNLTNGKDTCGKSDWKEGQSYPNVPITITQAGAMVTAKVEGIGGLLLGLGLGSAEYVGTISGDQLMLALHGKTTAMKGGCVYTTNSVVRAEVRGDLLTGTLREVPAGNGHPDCAIYARCHAEQSFNGARPPRAPAPTREP